MAVSRAARAAFSRLPALLLCGLAGFVPAATAAADPAGPPWTGSRLAAGDPTNGSPAAVGQPPQAAGDRASRYARALRDLEAGRLREAIAGLQAVVDEVPGDLGAQLDLAIAHCLSGDATSAGRLFTALEARPDLPPAIAEVIAWYREGACRPPRRSLQAFALTGVGYANNLNIAPSAGLIELPELGAVLALAEGSRPRSAGFTLLEAGLAQPLSADGDLTLGLHLQDTRYQGASTYNLAALQANLAWRRQQDGLRTEAQLGHASVLLGGASHLGALVASGALTRALTPAWSVGSTGVFTQRRYSELSNFDARQLELRGRLQWRHGGRAQLHADLGWQWDAAVRDRPGGDRQGPVLQLGGSWLPGGGHALEVSVRSTWLRDDAAYSPALFGPTRRAQHLTTSQATWRAPLSSRLTLRADLRHARSSDALPLFEYGASSISVGLEWATGP